MSKLKVIATGMGGRIGPHLLPSFQERYNLRVLDRQPVPDFPDTIIADLTDFDALRRAMEGIDVLVHLAATSDEAPFIEELVPNNVIGMYNAFEAARQGGAKRIIFASTCQTVTRYPHDVTVEITDPVRPSTLYGATKVFGEVVGRWFHEAHAIEFVGIRIGAFQPYDSPSLRNPQRWARSLWLSPGDCARLLHRAIEKPDVGYAVVFGTSITENEYLSRRPMRELLDFEPQDNVKDIPVD